MDFKLPKWADERNIHVFAGIEAVVKREKGIWYIKSQRCNMCGECCMDVSEKWSHGQNKDTGNCFHLKHAANEYLCNLGLNRPFSCCAEGAEGENFCSSKWELLK